VDCHGRGDVRTVQSAVDSCRTATATGSRSMSWPAMPSGGPTKRGHKQKKIHQEPSSKQMVNQGATSTADLTSSHENVG
jgi:hypothetical protein